MQKNDYQFFPYSIRPIEAIEKEFNTSITSGMDEKEVREKREKYGFNKISAKEIKWWDILIRQFYSPFIYLLVGASFLTFILGEDTDSLFITLFILINVSLGFYQEFKSDQSLKLLKKYISFDTVVWRDGKRKEINVENLVPGDIVEVKTGDIMAADARVFESDGLVMNESVLTGESICINKCINVLNKIPEDTYQAENLIFSGTTVSSGKGKAIVIAIGHNTAMGSVAKLTTETIKESKFSKGIDKFSSFILRLIFITLLFVFFANIIIKGRDANILNLMVFAIALAISVIPEALPVVSIFSLSRGALRLAKEKVVVRRLSAIEDLGGIEILCTDKTGTITENKLKVADVLKINESRSVLKYGYLGSSIFLGNNGADPFDVALKNAYLKESKDDFKGYERLKEIPFNPECRRNSVLIKKGNKLELIVRGAVESVISCCNEDISKYKEWINKEGKKGRRILAVAAKELKENSNNDIISQEKEMSLVGLISFIDPIKKTTKSAIDQARKLGVEVKIITGDAPEVAGAVAKSIELITSSDEVITGLELLKLKPLEQKRAVEQYSVFARITPQEKHLIISILQEKKSVGFLGEGINDAPALKAASVSLVVKGASDISRETADIILLQKNLSVIINGIKEGRVVFTNTMKYIKSTLCSNFGNFYAVAISSLFIDFFPMLPIQILLLNLLSDFPMITIATDNVSKEDISRPKKYNVHDIALIATILGIVSTIFDFIFFAMYFRISQEVLQTNWFIASILTELVFLFSIRTSRFALKADRPSGIVIWLTVIAAAFTIIIPYTAIGHNIFRFVSPLPEHLIVIISLVVVYFFVSEFIKLLYGHYFNNHNNNHNHNK